MNRGSKKIKNKNAKTRKRMERTGMGSSVPAQVQTDYLRTVVRPFVCTV